MLFLCLFTISSVPGSTDASSNGDSTMCLYCQVQKRCELLMKKTLVAVAEG